MFDNTQPMKKLLALTVLLAAFTASAQVKPLKVLLVTGGCCHNYGAQKDILKKGLEARANLQVTQIHTDDTTTKASFDMYKEVNWASGFDIVIHDECSADVKDTNIVANILGAHLAGVPAVNLHCAMHSYRTGTDAWFKYIGIQSASHGPQEPIELTHLDTDHPVTRGFTNWTTIKEELYNNIKVFPTAHALIRGKQTYKKKDGTDKVDEYVVAWTSDFGQTRVFSTTLGHNNATVADSRYLELVTRGLLWACGKLGPDGQPAPGYAAPAQRADARP